MATFSPAYAYPINFPEAQYHGTARYPGNTVFANTTGGFLGDLFESGMVAILGGMVGYFGLGGALPLYLFNRKISPRKRATSIPWWGQALILLFITMPLGGAIGALPGMYMAGSRVAQQGDAAAANLRPNFLNPTNRT